MYYGCGYSCHADVGVNYGVSLNARARVERTNAMRGRAAKESWPSEIKRDLAVIGVSLLGLRATSRFSAIVVGARVKGVSPDARS